MMEEKPVPVKASATEPLDQPLLADMGRVSPAWHSILSRHHAVVVLLFLLVLELVVFGQSYGKTGFFLDDWLTLFQFKFGPSNPLAAIHKYLVDDPRVLIRPLEAPYFGLLYHSFGFKASAYHYVNGAMEVITAFFFYLAMVRLTKSKAVSFIAAGLFIVNPTHDVTHYWMVCSSATLSLMLFMASMWSMFKAVEDKARGCYVTSGILLTLSLFNYESCIALPLATVVGVGLLLQGTQPGRTVLLRCFNVSCFLMIPVVVTFIYQRYLSPLIAYSWVKKIETDGSFIMPTITKGLEIQTPWALGEFVRKYLAADFFTGMNVVSGGLFVVVAVASLLLVAAFFASEQQRTGWKMAGFGLLFSILGLAVFGLNSEYMPLMITLVNRVNLAASAGASIITAVLIWKLFEFGSRFAPRHIVLPLASMAFCGVLVIFALCDRALAQPWLASTSVQNRIREVMKSNAPVLKDGDGVVVINCPRYVMWAPIADGTWDLQAMLRIAANNDKFFATSVSDRLQVSQTGLKDFVLGKKIADLPFDKLYSLEPHTAIFKRVSSAQEFIDAAQKATQRMGIKQSVVDNWKRGLGKLNENP